LSVVMLAGKVQPFQGKRVPGVRMDKYPVGKDLGTRGVAQNARDKLSRNGNPVG